MEKKASKTQYLRRTPSQFGSFMTETVSISYDPAEQVREMDTSSMIEDIWSRWHTWSARVRPGLRQKVKEDVAQETPDGEAQQLLQLLVSH